jgi:multicomponent Na+:H+ antiporter subunit E
MEVSDKKGSWLSRYLATAVALFIAWLAFSSTLDIQELLAGVVLVLLAAFMGWRGFSNRGLAIFHPRRIASLIIYLPVFFWQMLKANLDVAYRVIHPKMPIKPGIVAIKTGLKSDTGRLFLANSITLTPGTLTMDVSGDHLFIHWINVKEEDIERASKAIGGRFEGYLKRIFE